MSAAERRRPKSRRIRVANLARVEGEGALHVKIRGDEVVDARLEIFEPPRFFEAFLRGRDFNEVPDITARICGICPVAYQMSSCHALEDACAAPVGGTLRRLRRLLYCGEWIQSHALHIYLLHAPDFLGYESAIHMAADHRDAVQRGLDLKRTGNTLLDRLGGRAVHPVNVRLGGFHRVPSRGELIELLDPLRRARDLALETVRWVAGFEFPEFERAYEFVALRHEKDYPMNEGRVVSSAGLDIAIGEFEGRFAEEQVEHSTALHGRRRDGAVYFTGPLARYNLNHDHLSPLSREAAGAAGLGPVCRNPFRGIVVRAVELVHACDEALSIIETYEPPDQPAVEIVPRAATGYGCTEAPRGILYHRYTLDDRGTVLEARITPPTAQNQPVIEQDLRAFVERNLDLPQDRLQWRCEQVIRNYDPCISCSTHHLKLQLDRE